MVFLIGDKVTQKQIIDFIRHIDPEIKIEFVSERTMKRRKVPSVAYAMPYKWLVCFGKEIVKWNRIVVYSIILHELGHIYTGVTKSDSKDELRAQLWAIKIANLLKMYGLSEYLWKEIRDLDKTQSYKEGRRYFLASKLAKKLPHPIKSHKIYEAIEFKNGVSNPNWFNQLLEMIN
jgi:hypothetical protein